MSTETKRTTKELKALANERRLLIVRYLAAAHGAPVWRVAQKMSLSVKSASKHLLLLESARVLEREQTGLEVFYKLKKPRSPVVKACL
jgi:DNA-binding transcriptional ArsR family regulator